MAQYPLRRTGNLAHHRDDSSPHRLMPDGAGAYGTRDGNGTCVIGLGACEAIVESLPRIVI